MCVLGSQANIVVRFDVVQHAISLVQGRGRARRADSSHVVMCERADRTVTRLEAAASLAQDAGLQFSTTLQQ